MARKPRDLDEAFDNAKKTIMKNFRYPSMGGAGLIMIIDHLLQSVDGTSSVAAKPAEDDGLRQDVDALKEALKSVADAVESLRAEVREIKSRPAKRRPAKSKSRPKSAPTLTDDKESPEHEDTI